MTNTEKEKKAVNYLREFIKMQRNQYSIPRCSVADIIRQKKTGKISRSWLDKFEAGTFDNITAERFVAICDAIGMSTDYIQQIWNKYCEMQEVPSEELPFEILSFSSPERNYMSKKDLENTTSDIYNRVASLEKGVLTLFFNRQIDDAEKEIYSKLVNEFKQAYEKNMKALYDHERNKDFPEEAKQEKGE